MRQVAPEIPRQPTPEETRLQLKRECFRLIHQIAAKPAGIKLLRAAKRELRLYLGYKAGRTFKRRQRN